LGVKSGQSVGLTTLPPSMSRMSESVGASTSRNPKGLHGLYRYNFTFYILLMRFLQGTGSPHNERIHIVAYLRRLLLSNGVERCDAMSDSFTARLSSARVGYPRLCSALLGSARHCKEITPLRLLLRNHGSVFRCYNSYMA
jgi:hypothetical protein